MVHREFDIEAAIQRYPLEATRHAVREWARASPWAPESAVEFEYYVRLNGPTGESISTELDAALVEQLRCEVRRERSLGRSVATDVFVWQPGDSANLGATRVGGAPCGDVKDWPTDPQTKSPMHFIAQICFSDSHDLVGSTPDEVLLIFNTLEVDHRGDHYQGQHWTFRWCGLKQADAALNPECCPQFFPEVVCHGLRWRTADYPDSWDAFENHEPLRNPKSPGESLARAYLLTTLEATRIGGEPRGIQSPPSVGGSFLAEFHSVCCADPNRDSGAHRFSPATLPSRGVLDIGDGGSVYIGIDERGEIRWDWQCY